MGNFKDLQVWKNGCDLSVRIHKLYGKLPSSEKYGLISQARRAAVSIPQNIAEGSARGTDSDFARFLRIALGSAAELETLLEITPRLYEVDQSEYDSALLELNQIQRQTRRLVDTLAHKHMREHKAPYEVDPDEEVYQ
ncbi:MAG: four helix bundle protein [Chthonomonas sp.]|nr:four helix bundle protein [Chthonomonas sp.]